MKQMAMTFILMISLFYCIAIGSNQLAVAYYEEGLSTAMENSIRHSLTALSEPGAAEITDEQELYAAFLQDLVLQMGEKAVCDIDVYELDYSQGILDVKATLTVSLPFGGSEAISCRKRGKLEV